MTSVLAVTDDRDMTQTPAARERAEIRPPQEVRMIKHTPGEWTVSLPDETVVTTKRTDIVQSQAEHDYEEHFEEYAANANLIAAAPELLAALKFTQCAINPLTFALLSMHEWKQQLAVAAERIHKAIAKAEGHDHA